MLIELMIKLVICWLIGLAILSLIGCGVMIDFTTPEKLTHEEITLDTGLECVKIIYGSTIGLSCNWEKFNR